MSIGKRAAPRWDRDVRAAMNGLPVEGQRITHRHVSALAAIAYFEGSLRPLARAWRRPAKQRPARFDPQPPGPAG